MLVVKSKVQIEVIAEPGIAGSMPVELALGMPIISEEHAGWKPALPAFDLES